MWSVSINRTSKEHPFTFLDLQALQDRAITSAQKTLLFAELEPVITLGQRQIAWDQRPIFGSNVPVIAGERGGNETWHGPGQWVCFIVAPLKEWVGDDRGVRKAITKTLTNILPIIQEYAPDAQIEEGERLGIWSKEGKLASIGIKIQNGWMKSGFAVNVFPTKDSFLGINPCGLAAKPDFLFKKNVLSEDWEKHFQEFPLKFKAALLDKN